VLDEAAGPQSSSAKVGLPGPSDYELAPGNEVLPGPSARAGDPAGQYVQGVVKFVSFSFC